MQPPAPGAWTMTGRQPAARGAPQQCPQGFLGAVLQHAPPLQSRGLLEPWGTPGPPKWSVFGGSGL